jgi:hypothetical protein
MKIYEYTSAAQFWRVFVPAKAERRACTLATPALPYSSMDRGAGLWLSSTYTRKQAASILRTAHARACPAQRARRVRNED